MKRRWLNAIPERLRAIPPLRGTVVDVERIAPRIVAVSLEGPELRLLGPFVPGQQLDVLVESVWPVGGRHYSPVYVDHDRGQLQLVAHLHGNGPGSHCFQALSRGDIVTVWGPGGGFRLASYSRPSVFVGDETTLGVFAAMYRALDDGQTVRGAARGVVSIADSGEEAAIRALALPCVAAVREGADPAEETLRWLDTASLADDPMFYLAGRLATVRAARQRLRERGVELKNIRTKPFWAEGRRAL